MHSFDLMRGRLTTVEVTEDVAKEIVCPRPRDPKVRRSKTAINDSSAPLSLLCQNNIGHFVDSLHHRSHAGTSETVVGAKVPSVGIRDRSDRAIEDGHFAVDCLAFNVIGSFGTDSIGKTEIVLSVGSKVDKHSASIVDIVGNGNSVGIEPALQCRSTAISSFHIESFRAED